LILFINAKRYEKLLYLLVVAQFVSAILK